jgi:GNAT superfamily N-acetyltransferase
MNFRLANTTDIPILIGMIKSFYIEDHHKYQEKKIRKALGEIIREKEWGKVFLIEFKNQIIGYFILTYGWSLEYFGRDIFIDEIFIKKSFRGLGLGKRSLEFIEQYVKENNILAIHLEVNKYNMAKKLYESRGYHSHDSDLMSKRF